MSLSTRALRLAPMSALAVPLQQGAFTTWGILRRLTIWPSTAIAFSTVIVISEHLPSQAFFTLFTQPVAVAPAAMTTLPLTVTLERTMKSSALPTDISSAMIGSLRVTLTTVPAVRVTSWSIAITAGGRVEAVAKRLEPAKRVAAAKQERKKICLN